MASQFKTFTAGSVLTASEVNSYLMKQAVIVCDSSSDYPTSPVEGMTVYDKALDSVLSYSGAAWVRVVPVTSNGVQTWTPAVTQSGAVTVTVTEANYVRTGCIVEAWMLLAVTGSGTTNNSVTITLPVTASGNATGTTLGSVMLLVGGTVYTGVVGLASSTTMAFRVASSGGTNTFGSSPNVALANGDSIRAHFRYLV